MNTQLLIVFDAFGTLFDPESVTPELDAAFPGAGSELRRRWQEKEHALAWPLSLMGTYVDYEQIGRMALTSACRQLNLDAKLVRRYDLARLTERFAPFMDVPQGLDALYRDGHKLVILSNGTPRQIHTLIQHSGLSVPIDILSVQPAGRYKPHPAAYALISTTYSVPNTHVLFVSAHEWDIAGAATYGFKTVWINRTYEPYEAFSMLPNWRVANLPQLATDLSSTPAPNMH